MISHAEVCEINEIHTDTVTKVRANMPDADIFREAADFFKALSNDTRMRIIWALDQQEMCVCDLASALDMTKSAVSHQLALLRAARLVRNRRDGKEVFYSLADDHVKKMLESGIEHTQE